MNPSNSISISRLQLPTVRVLPFVFWIAWSLTGCVHFVSDQQAEPAFSLRGSDQAIEAVFGREHIGRTIDIVRIPAHTLPAGADITKVIAWSGLVPASGKISLPRFAKDTDLLFARYQAVDRISGVPIGSPQGISRIDVSGAHTFPFLKSTSKKGLACIVDFDDARSLGVQHTNYNISIGKLIDSSNAGSDLFEDVDGQRIFFSRGYVAEMDAALRRATHQGINVLGILLNPLGDLEKLGNEPLRHPGTLVHEQHPILGAFNVTSAEGLRHYRAALQFLLRRYTHPGAPHGWMSGLIIGNEITSHFIWHNQGEVPMEDVLRDYLVATRVAWLVSQQFHPDFRIYISLDHHWTQLGTDSNPRRSIRGRELLETMAQRTRAEGDFPWQIAIHPYPESMFRADFWHDRLAPLHNDALKLTFHNLEVLEFFLRQPHMLYRGTPRRVSLSEQGFNYNGTEQGEYEQAAAYALAAYKVDRLPLIDSFLYHRQVDHPGEGGLKLGLCASNSPTDDTAPGAKRLIWDTFRTAGTPEGNEARAFALKISGYASWAAVGPATKLDVVPPKARSD